MSKYDFSTFGVKEQNQIKTEFDLHLEKLEINGFTIFDNILNEHQLSEIRKKLDSIYQLQINEVENEDNLFKINDAYNVRAPLVYDEQFLFDVAANEKIIEFVKIVLGDYFILMLQNGVFNMPQTDKKPNAYAYHRDLNYQHFISSRPLSISALFCIDDFNATTGGTYVLPFTHKIEKCPSNEYIQENEKGIIAKAGSVIVFNSMMYHRSGVNTSRNVRRAINNMYTLPFIKQQISFPSMLKGKFSNESFFSQFLGYTSQSELNVTEFRKNRLHRKL